MTTKIKRISSAICALVMLATAMTGCKKNTSDDSQYSVIEIVDYESADNDSSTGSGTNDTKSNNSSSSAKDNSSSGTSGSDNGAVNPADYKGTTVQYATWQYADGIDTDAAIAKFKKKYGISVQLVTVPQATYVQEITSLINAGKAPDVIRDWQYFPSYLTIGQPLENAKIDLTDPIWDQNVIKSREINGKHYGINSVGGLFNAPGAIVFYNKKLLNSNGIKTPEDYKNIGKWNFDAFYQIMKSVAAIGKGYEGVYVDNFGQIISQSFGTDIYKYVDGKFVSGINDPMLTTVWQMVTKWAKEGLVDTNTGREIFINGKCGLAVTGSYGLKKSGYWRDMNAKDIGYIELPELNGTKPSTPVTNALWGICKGSKNPVAAGIFLRYYLDANNYNMANEFISSDAANYAAKLSTSANINKSFADCSTSVCLVNGISNKKYYQDLMDVDPSQVPQYFQSISNEINSYLKAAQKVLDDNSK